jgi:hypothetical protein
MKKTELELLINQNAEKIDILEQGINTFKCALKGSLLLNDVIMETYRKRLCRLEEDANKNSTLEQHIHALQDMLDSHIRQSERVWKRTEEVVSQFRRDGGVLNESNTNKTDSTDESCDEMP